MSFIKKLFKNKLIDDERAPIVSFEIPGVNGTFGLLPPLGEFWLQLIYLVIIISILEVAIGFVNYKTIVQHRGKPHTYLIGWGIILPGTLYFTYQMIEFLNIQNRALLLVFGQPFGFVGSRTMEAMYGTSPIAVEHSLSNYMTYYSATIDFYWDPQTMERKPVERMEVLQTMGRVTYYFIATCLLYSFLVHFDFVPFDSPVALEAVNLNFDLISPAHLGNAYLLAILTYLVVLCELEIANMVENFKGYKTKPTFNNPLFESSSPTDFWGRRWNLMVHRILKRGVYLPCRQFFSNAVSALMTFVVSGLLHEYLWTIIFYEHAHRRNESGFCSDERCYQPIYIKTMALFGWCGLLCVVEKYIGKMSIFQWISKNLPVLVVSTMVVLLALPFSHWLTGDMVRGGYFTDFGLGIFNIIKID